MEKHEFREDFSIFLGLLQDDAFAMGDALRSKALEISAVSENPEIAPDEAFFAAAWYGKAQAYGFVRECFDSALTDIPNNQEG